MNKLDDKFVQSNLGLVHSIAARFRGRGIEYEELFSAGCEGLVKAARGFDEERGLKFSTYAVPVIMGEIRRLFRDGGAVKVSRGLKELSLKVIRVREQLRKKGTEPRLSDIANELGITVEQAGEAVAAAVPPMSLTEADDDGGEFDIPAQPEQIKLTEHIALQQCLALLDEEERRLIFMRFWENKTQSEAGKLLGMSQVQVSRKEKRVLLKLRELLNG